MFYTAVSNAGHHVFDQRIGRRSHRPAPVAPARRPEPEALRRLALVQDVGCNPAPDQRSRLEDSSETWRDPLVFTDPDGRRLAHADQRPGRHAAHNDDGVVAHATSPDWITWTLGAAAVPAGPGFGQLEVLQNKQIDGRWVLVFTCHPQEMTAARGPSSASTAPGRCPPPARSGPWDITLARPFTAEPDLFAAPLVQLRDGRWAIVGFRNLEPKGGDAFEILDPIPVTLDDEGYLVAR